MPNRTTSPTVCVDAAELRDRHVDELPVVREVIRWDLERLVRLVVGLVVVLSVALSVAFPPARFIAGAMGAGSIVAAVTNACMLGMLLTKLPANRPRTATGS